MGLTDRIGGDLPVLWFVLLVGILHIKQKGLGVGIKDLVWKIRLSEGFLKKNDRCQVRTGDLIGVSDAW